MLNFIVNMNYLSENGYKNTPSTGKNQTILKKIDRFFGYSKKTL